MDDSERVYVQCAEVISLFQAQQEDLAALLDPENGLATRLKEICREQWVQWTCLTGRLEEADDTVCSRIAELEERPSNSVSRDEIDLLKLEENTWGLLQAVMPYVSFFLGHDSY
jgi:nuclear pore complex protein Nup107